jgi:hypothetical protein
MKSGYINTVLSWPSPSGGLATRLLRGRVVHAVYQHDNWCRTLNGGKASDCNCDPIVSYHLQPNEK